jgi:GH15 family glucan-1,4-alpha-glucosidase
MCWAACDRLAKIALRFQLKESQVLWRSRADSIRERILRDAWNEQRQAFVESFGGKDLDASVLLMPEVGLLPASDPRFLSTLAALEATLCDGPFMRRYEARDDFGPPESAFNVCAFWRIDALARCGRKDEARMHFEAMLARCNHVGLLSEDVDRRTGELWGNFPQTYSMVGIINGAMRLSESWDQAV